MDTDHDNTVLFEETQRVSNMALLVIEIPILVLIYFLATDLENMPVPVFLTLTLLFVLMIVLGRLEKILTTIDDEGIHLQTRPRWLLYPYSINHDFLLGSIVSFRIVNLPISSKLGAYWQWGLIVGNTLNLGKKHGVELRYKNRLKDTYSLPLVLGTARPQELLAALEKLTGLPPLPPERKIKQL
jgi:hypothetical protein